MATGDRMRKIRQDKKMTRKQLKEKSGVPEITISQYELGKRQPKVEQLQKIADALEIPLSYLMDVDRVIMDMRKNAIINKRVLEEAADALELPFDIFLQRAAGEYILNHLGHVWLDEHENRSDSNE